ncbi:collagen alpha-1(III) chain-like [Pleurodeles waltl]|uniref:collagen alpha-1(III) chain-like n=1 Tax=Pleurodeles waltl TaxID=8319 RepID=UPI003709859E
MASPEKGAQTVHPGPEEGPGHPGTQAQPGPEEGPGAPGTQAQPGLVEGPGAPGTQAQPGPEEGTGPPGTQAQPGPEEGPGAPGTQAQPGLVEGPGAPGTQAQPGLVEYSGSPETQAQPGPEEGTGAPGTQAQPGPEEGPGAPGTQAQPGPEEGPGREARPGLVEGTGAPGTQAQPGPEEGTGAPGTQAQPGPEEGTGAPGTQAQPGPEEGPGAPGTQAQPGPEEGPGREARPGLVEGSGPPGTQAQPGPVEGPGAPEREAQPLFLQGHYSAGSSPASSAASTPSPSRQCFGLSWSPPESFIPGGDTPLLEGTGPGGHRGETPERPPKKDQPGVWAGLWKLGSWRALSGLLAAALMTFFGLWLSYVLNAPSGGAEPREPCPDVWMYYAKHCYYYAENETDWKSAREFCEANKASLVTFRDRHEMDYILKRAGKKSYWIGLRKREKGLEWISGDLLDNSLFQTQGDEECGFIWSKNGLVISLSTCSLPRSSVCKGEPFS